MFTRQTIYAPIRCLYTITWFQCMGVIRSRYICVFSNYTHMILTYKCIALKCKYRSFRYKYNECQDSHTLYKTHTYLINNKQTMLDEHIHCQCANICCRGANIILQNMHAMIQITHILQYKHICHILKKKSMIWNGLCSNMQKCFARCEHVLSRYKHMFKK